MNRHLLSSVSSLHSPTRSPTRRSYILLLWLPFSLATQALEKPIRRSFGTAKQSALETGLNVPAKTGEFYKEINAQIDQAFDNCELNLRHAGGQGWSQVVRVNSYHVPINNEALDAMVRNFKKWMPNHQPIWTCVGVPRLGEDDMRVEIEVVAVDEDGKPIAT
ncbi:hypothetical protein D6D22_04133 [Aureobasidium pullulans]|uniref:Uncharacterized protein n=1 Tax=Aureobasidium pullulans TaxID=5580 RepID=A0A4S8Y0S1_AURPU|nr:hypothetical protein D6D22_04133 [Aureobasidium pullulans]